MVCIATGLVFDNWAMLLWLTLYAVKCQSLCQVVTTLGGLQTFPLYIINLCLDAQVGGANLW